MNKNSWRYVSLSEDALASINHYDPTDDIINRLDKEKLDDEEELENYEPLSSEGPDLYDLLSDESTTLSKRQKQVLDLRLIQDKTFSQIGFIIGTTRQNAYQTYLLAINNIRDSLELGD